jgi:hypothetical protein
MNQVPADWWAGLARWNTTCHASNADWYRVFGFRFRLLRFRVLGFRGLGLRVLGFQGLRFRV